MDQLILLHLHLIGKDVST